MATTSNMGLTLPDVSVTPGPAWASQINSDLTLIDQHNHTDSKGLPIPTAGLNINEELKFNNNNSLGLPATGLSYVGLISPQTPPAPARVFSDVAGNLYYRNTSGDDVQLTIGNTIAATPGSISGLPFGTASANYDRVTGTFIWSKATNQGATMDSGPVRIRDGSSGSNAVTLTPPGGMAASYTRTLLPALPAQQSLLGVSTSGAESSVTVNSTLSLTSSLLKVSDLGIDTPQLKNGCVTTDKLGSLQVTTAKIADATVTQPKWGSKSFVYSPAVVADSTSSTVLTQIANMAVSAVLRAGYSVRVELVPSLSGYSCIQMGTASAGPVTAFFEAEVIAPGPITLSYPVLRLAISNSTRVPVTSFSFIYLPTQSGLHTFWAYWSVAAGADTVFIQNAKLVVFEQ